MLWLIWLIALVLYTGFMIFTYTRKGILYKWFFALLAIFGTIGLSAFALYLVIHGA